MNHTVLPLRPEQFRQVSTMLARAFDSDPLMRHYLPDAAQRNQLLPGVVGAGVRYCMLYGEVHTTPDLEGAACWLPPGRTMMTGWGLLRAGLGIVSLRFVWIAYRRMQEVEPLLERVHKEFAPMPHWYLALLGVEPDCQGRGIGGQLIAPVLERAGSAGLPCYLETMSECNVAFYSRYGFAVVKEFNLPPSGLRIWTMLRAG